MRSKKAQESLELNLRHAYHLILAFVSIVLIMAVYFNSYSEEFVEKRTLATNTALLLDTMAVANGDVYITQDYKDNTILIQQNEVVITETVPIKKDFIESPNLEISQGSFSGSTDYLKTGSRIAIGQDLEQIQLACPYVTVETPADLLIMPQTENGEEFFFTASIVNSIDTIPTTAADTITKKPNAILTIDFTEDPILRAEIPQDSPKSRRLACEILNTLQKENPDLQSQILISDDTLFNQANKVVSLTLNNNLKENKYANLISESVKQTVS